MTVIGISGPIGHGKTTLARELARNEPSSVVFESSQVIIDFANILRSNLDGSYLKQDQLDYFTSVLEKTVREYFGIEVNPGQLKIDKDKVEQHSEIYNKLFDYFQIVNSNEQLIDAVINTENKEVFRPLLQWLGGYLVSAVKATIWFDELIRMANIANKTNGTSLAIICGVRYKKDAEVIRSANGIVLSIVRPDHSELDKNDPTEAERGQISVDSTIINNGKIEDLSRVSGQILADIKNKKLKPAYKSA